MLFVNVVYYNYRILFIAVNIKNIVVMSDNKQFVKTRAQPPSHVAVAKTVAATAHYTHTAHTESTQCHPSVPSANCRTFAIFPLLLCRHLATRVARRTF